MRKNKFEFIIDSEFQSQIPAFWTIPFIAVRLHLVAARLKRNLALETKCTL